MFLVSLILLLKIPVILSLSVGEEIDKKEKNHYKLFSGIKDFEIARVYKTEKNLYEIEISGKEGVLIIQTDSLFIHHLKKYIEFFEEFKNDTSFVNSFQREWEKIFSKSQIPEKEFPPLEEKEINEPSFRKILGEFFGGVLTGILLGSASEILIKNFLGYKNHVEFNSFTFRIVYSFGCALGAYQIGKSKNETGSFLTTLLYSYGGILWGSVIDNDLVYFLSPPIGAIIGFNTTRKKKPFSSSYYIPETNSGFTVNFSFDEKKKELLKLAEKENLREWAEFVLKYSSDSDILNFDYENFILHLKAIRQNFEKVPWKDKINDYLLYHYVLPPRVSQEPLENFTWIYKDTLYNLVKNSKSMKEAVLKINEWCFTKMKYQPTSRWDQNAKGTIKRGFGRCEEMVILFIKALKTVCIPVREAYTPWWPFTESNHAWCEVWVDGKWHSVGGAEPADLDFAWFRNSVKRAGLILSPVFGEVKQKGELIHKKGKNYTILNITHNYTEPYRVYIKTEKDAIVSFCIYNYSAFVPLFVDTLKRGERLYTLGKTDYFIYAFKDSLFGYKILRPRSDFDTVIIKIDKKELNDTSLWIYVKEPSMDAVKPSYKPDTDSLKSLQEKHFGKISFIDSSKVRDKRLLKILKNSRGNKNKILKFYEKLSLLEKEDFLEFFENTHPKDLVMMDTLNLRKEIKFIRNSIKLSKNVADSIIRDYLIPERILFEEFGFYREYLFDKFKKFLNKNPSKTAQKIFDWVKNNVKEEKQREFFKPLLNPIYTCEIKRAGNIERYILICGILRTLGIPSKVKWNYKGVLYWDNGWKELSFEKENLLEKSILIVKFLRDGKNISEDFKYFENYSILSLKEYPERKEPDVIKQDTLQIIELDKDIYYLVSGFRNAKGDAFVRIKKVDLRRKDTLKISFDASIPYKDLKAGQLVVRKYSGFKGMGNLGIKKEEIERGKTLLIFLDLKSEESRSTLLNAKDAIKKFKGKVFFFGENKGEIKEFLKDAGIKTEKVYSVEEKILKRWGIKKLPSVLYLKDNKPIFWIEGLTLHLKDLISIE